jgi:uncharacterized protein YndB with AHSA1/START domain
MIRGSLRLANGAGVVHLEVSLDRNVNDVWSALTDPEDLSQWLGKIDGELRPGGDFSAYFFATGWEGTGHVDACEAPQLLRILTKSEGEPDCIIEITLAADGERSNVVFEDRGLPLEQIAAYGAGDQVLVEDLAAYLDGQDRCDARARWQELHPAYQTLATNLA